MVFEGDEVHAGRLAEGAIHRNSIGSLDQTGEGHAAESLFVELDEGGTANLIQFVFRRELGIQRTFLFDPLNQFRRERRQAFAIEGIIPYDAPVCTNGHGKARRAYR